MCLMGGSAAMFAVNLIVRSRFSENCCLSLTVRQAGAVYEGSLINPAKAPTYASAATAMLFLFNLA